MKQPPEISKGAELLLGWRLSKELHQDDASKLVGIDVAAYCKLETGYRRPGLPLAVGIQDRTGVPVTAWMEPCSAKYKRQRTKAA